MTTAAIREKLHEYINTADDNKVETIYSIFEDQIAERYDHWNDEEFLQEIKSRVDEFESGDDKGLSWEEVKIKARAELKAKRS